MNGVCRCSMSARFGVAEYGERKSSQSDLSSWWSQALQKSGACAPVLNSPTSPVVAHSLLRHCLSYASVSSLTMVTRHWERSASTVPKLRHERFVGSFLDGIRRAAKSSFSTFPEGVSSLGWGNDKGR